MSFTPEIDFAFKENIPTLVQLPSDSPSLIADWKVPANNTLLTHPDFQLHLQLQFLKKDAGPKTAEMETDPAYLTPSDNVAPIALIHNTLFKAAEVYVNQVLVSPHQTTAPYVSYIRWCTQYPKQTKETMLSRMMGTFDTDDAFDVIGGLNKGFEKRAKDISLGRTVDLYGPLLMADICRQDQPFVQQTEIQVRLFRASDEFCLMSNDENNKTPYRILVTKAELIVTRLRPTPASLDYLSRHLTVYSLESWESRPFVFAKGIQSNNIEIIETNRKIRRAYIVQLSQKSYDGHYKGNALHFQTFGLSSLALQINHNYFKPTTPFQCLIDVPNGIVQHSVLYYESLAAMGYTPATMDLDFSYLNFSGGRCIMCFNFEQDDLAKTPDASNNIRLLCEYSKALAENIIVLVIFVFERTLKIVPGQTVSVE